MKLPSNPKVMISIACLGLAACDAPTLVSLQPIGAPQPTNAQQTFVDADGCSWWIIGKNNDLRWAPMTNAVGEHVCDGGQSQLSTLGSDLTDTPAAPIPAGTDFVSETRAAIEGVEAPAAAPTAPVADGRQSYVQVATFAKEDNAIASEKLFRSLGYRISSGSEARDNDRLFRLILGPFATRDEAQKAVERAFAEGFDDAFPFRR
jgi:hypothetical protein